jgi:hypothetical protein
MSGPRQGARAQGEASGGPVSMVLELIEIGQVEGAKAKLFCEASQGSQDGRWRGA